MKIDAKRAAFGGLLTGVMLAAASIVWQQSIPMVSGMLPQQAYLWQRQWTGNVTTAAEQADARENPLAGLCVAYAEIESMAGSSPVVHRTMGVDWAALARCRKPMGFAVRVREFPGEVSVNREPFPTLRNVVDELDRATHDAGLRPAEIEIDFDCPTSRLRGFRAWLEVLQRAFPAETFRFTALPAWLRSPEFVPLARATGGYVLQLHWLEKPGTNGHPPVTLCDPTQARVTVERAARLGVPFRAALPTYGYRLILDAQGKLLAAAGEGAAMEAARPPPGGASRTLMADPVAMADLIHDWQERRPGMLQGVIWYRLPVTGERLNWAARTLWAVVAGRHPQGKLRLQFARAEIDGPCELRLRNDGDADAPLPSSIVVHCASVPAAADGVGGFVLEQNGLSVKELVFTPRMIRGAARVVPAGESILFGWVRPAGDNAAEPVEAQFTGSLTPAPRVSNP